MKVREFLLIALLFTISADAQTKKFTNSPAKTPPPLPATAVPDKYTQQLFSNSQVRAHRIQLPPGATTFTLRHEHDFLIVSLGTNDFNLVGAANSIAFSMTDGEVQVVTGNWSNRVLNKSQKPLHIVEIEALHDIAPERAMCGLAAKSCIGSRFAYNETTNYVESPLFETPSLRLSRLQIEPGSGMPQHRDAGDQLMIALNDQQLLNAVEENLSTINAHAGDVQWFRGGSTHRLANQGSQAARFLTIELK